MASIRRDNGKIVLIALGLVKLRLNMKRQASGIVALAKKLGWPQLCGGSNASCEHAMVAAPGAVIPAGVPPARLAGRSEHSLVAFFGSWENPS
jgi:hypothetical protein